MKIGILTGGGDVPGLNACIKALVHSATEAGHEVIGILRGWKGALCFNPADASSFGENCVPLNKAVVRTIDRTGGTIASASAPPSRAAFNTFINCAPTPVHRNASPSSNCLAGTRVR